MLPLSPKQIIALSIHIENVKNMVKLNIDLKIIQEITKNVFDEEEKSLSSYKINLVEKDEEKIISNPEDNEQKITPKDALVNEDDKEYPNFISPPSHFTEPKEYSLYWNRFSQSSNDMSIFKMIHDDKNLTTMEHAFKKQVIYF